MSAVNVTDETRPSVAASCSHANTRKAVRFGKKCAVCDSRVWKFWKARKCRDCKTVMHKYCVAAWEKYTARQAIAPYVVPAAPAEVKPAERARDGIAPMYVYPRPWILANVTEVTVDCRRGAAPLSVTVSHGYALTATMFRGLFDTPSATVATALAAVTASYRPAVKPLDARPQETGDGDRTGRAGDVEGEGRETSS